MAITECGRGHVYDSDQYGACPYCNSNMNIIDFQASPPMQQMGQTVAPGNAPAFPMEPVGETVAPESYRKQQQEREKTVGIFAKRYRIDPVVGWLVCIEGPEKGTDYHLWAKINKIGRGESMDVCIRADRTISKENHAKLAYDPKHNTFQLIPGDSVNNIYLNEEPVYIPAKLKAYDQIELGESKFLFVPFCGDQFRWNTDSE